MKGILVTGTDTDVGKSWFMLKFGSLLKEKNRNFHFGGNFSYSIDDLTPAFSVFAKNAA